MLKNKYSNSYNLKAFKKILSNYKDLKYKLDNTKGTLTLLYNEKPITSKYAPYEEAKRLVDGLVSDREYSIGVFLGLAAFYQVEYFLTKNDKDKIVIIIEKDIEVFSLVYNEIKEKIIDNIIFLIDEESGYILNALDHLIKEEEAKSVLLVRHIRATSVTLEYREYYDNIEQLFYTLIKEKLMSFSTASYFSPIWSKNIFLNIKLNNANSVVSLKGALKKKIPVLLIAAGASIDNTIEKIKSLQNTHFIIAVSHSLNALIKNGIKPDAIVTVDGGFYSSFHLFAIRNKNYNIKIFTTHTAYPASINNFDKDNIFYFSHNESFEKMIFNDSIYLPMEGSVIMPAFRLSLLLEPKYIVLAGADFCYKENQTHSKYSVIYDIYFTTQNKINTFENKVHINKKSKLELECYDGVSRESDYKLLSYYRHFEKIVSDTKETKIYFLTKESAKLKNVEEYDFPYCPILKNTMEINKVQEKVYTEIFYKEIHNLYYYLINDKLEKAAENTLAKTISPLHTDNFLKDKIKYRDDFKSFFTEWFKSIGITK